MRFHSFHLLLLAAAFAVAAPAPMASAQPAAYSISDSTTGYILEGANTRKKLQIGSLTAIAAAMVALDWSEAKQKDLNEFATVPEAAVTLGNSGEGVPWHDGDRCSLRDLLYATLMQSDDAAAETVALHVGASLSGGQATPSIAFVAQMNALARRLGMRNTRFLNAHGRDNLERSLPYSTAEDLALLTRYAMQRSAFVFYVSQRERRISIQAATGETSSYLLRNTNELLGADKIDGVKTGATRNAGPCVIVSAARPPESKQQGDQTLITPRRLNVVVLGSTDRFAAARQLLEHGWGLYDAWAAAGRPMKGARAR